MDASFLFLCFQLSTSAWLRSILMRLQADNPLRADVRVMDEACRQIKPVACFQGKLLAELRQPERDAPLHHIDDLVVSMGVRRINIHWTV